MIIFVIHAIQVNLEYKILRLHHVFARMDITKIQMKYANLVMRNATHAVRKLIF